MAGWPRWADVICLSMRDDLLETSLQPGYGQGHDFLVLNATNERAKHSHFKTHIVDKAKMEVRVEGKKVE